MAVSKVRWCCTNCGTRYEDYLAKPVCPYCQWQLEDDTAPQTPLERRLQALERRVERLEDQVVHNSGRLNFIVEWLKKMRR